MGREIKRVAVFCASGARVPKTHIEFAEIFGRELGTAGFDLVWGGCSVASMGAVARGVASAGRRTIGVIPQRLKERGLAFDSADELIVVDGLAERKSRMKALADVFAVLPGGIGTLDEFISLLAEQIIDVRHGAEPKKIAVVNWNGFYNPLENLLEELYRGGFAYEQYRELYRIIPDSNSVIAYLRDKKFKKRYEW